MTSIDLNPSQDKISGGRRISRGIFMGLSWILVACITIQVYIAGSAVFQNPVNWRLHENFVHFFGFAPLLMIIFAITGKCFKGSAWLSLAMFVLIDMQYMTAHVPALGAIHPVMALVLILLSLYTALRSTPRQ
ncbi:DUF6220 domain-containing protein [Paenibacillus sp. AR247]|uniref:DUF6220 domain-containing protein n=1 Tax=Paenibacillus sp. AR247 TaxID=1631599 RepID=UPI000CF9588A|nr:DUF6220 domain-containing protein [Paenibacillus sp. AR247]PQP91161.1 hypothetical protein CPT76_01015 [Paenibacillus sp. AR247]